MKRIAFICGLVAALLCLTQNASAQYSRRGVNFLDEGGFTVSDTQLINLVGQNVFDETVVGARKQYKAGNGLIWGGVAGLCVGLAGTVFTGVKLANSSYTDLETAITNDSSIAAMYLASTAVMSLGGTLFSGGIVFKTIGKKRLNWVADQANGVKLSYHVGATPSGVGLALQF